MSPCWSGAGAQNLCVLALAGTSGVTPIAMCPQISLSPLPAPRGIILGPTSASERNMPCSSVGVIFNVNFNPGTRVVPVSPSV